MSCLIFPSVREERRRAWPTVSWVPAEQTTSLCVRDESVGGARVPGGWELGRPRPMSHLPAGWGCHGQWPLGAGPEVSRQVWGGV